MKVIDWKMDCGANYARVLEGMNSLLERYTQKDETIKPGAHKQVLLHIEVDTGRYIVFQDKHGYAWIQIPGQHDQEPQFRILTTSVNKFIDKVIEYDKQIRLTATV